jgi:Tfp pilus assembly protein PilE
MEYRNQQRGVTLLELVVVIVFKEQTTALAQRRPQ